MFRKLAHYLGQTSQSISNEYLIERELRSPATTIIFPVHPTDICLKLWIPCKNEVYNTLDVSACTTYLLDGLAFNRRFAPKIYHGIVPVVERNEQKISCGSLIADPEAKKLDFDVTYALVMKRLPENWRLDHQLLNSNMSAYGGMSFLAQSVAAMHSQLEPASADLALSGHIAEKFSLNRRVFDQALQALTQENVNMEAYKPIGDFMERACRKLTRLFEQRAREGHIKRCHGDLKASNLWIQPEYSSSQGPRKTEANLLPLDCIDFNPSFCNIDTLSDVAMLAVDLEMRLLSVATSTAMPRGRAQIKLFLQTYLNVMQEPERADIWLLLEYYMTEKAMICAYMNILYSGLPIVGRRYLEIALNHACDLAAFLRLPLTPRRKTLPLATHSRYSQSGFVNE